MARNVLVKYIIHTDLKWSVSTCSQTLNSYSGWIMCFPFLFVEIEIKTIGVKEIESLHRVFSLQGVSHRWNFDYCTRLWSALCYVGISFLINYGLYTTRHNISQLDGKYIHPNVWPCVCIWYSWSLLVYWGLYNASYQGGADDDEMPVSLVEETGAPGGNQVK